MGQANGQTNPDIQQLILSATEAELTLPQVPASLFDVSASFNHNN